MLAAVQGHQVQSAPAANADILCTWCHAVQPCLLLRYQARESHWKSLRTAMKLLTLCRLPPAADANILINTCRIAAQRYLLTYSQPIPVEQLVRALCDNKQVGGDCAGRGSSSLYPYCSNGRVCL